MFELIIVMGKFNFNLRVNDHMARLVSSVADDASSYPGANQLAMLAQQIQSVYTLGELRQAALFLDVEFENLPGNTIFDKAYGLVSYFHSRCTASHLCAYLIVDRPHICWQALFDNLPSSMMASPSSMMASPILTN